MSNMAKLDRIQYLCEANWDTKSGKISPYELMYQQFRVITIKYIKGRYLLSTSQASEIWSDHMLIGTICDCMGWQVDPVVTALVYRTLMVESDWSNPGM